MISSWAERSYFFMTKKDGIIGRRESPHYRGPDRTHPFQKDGTSHDPNSEIYSARQEGLELLKKMRVGQGAVANLLAILTERATKEQTYLEMVQDWFELQKATGLTDSRLSALPLGKLRLLDTIVNGDDVKEQIAQEITDMLTAPEVPDRSLV